MSNLSVKAEAVLLPMVYKCADIQEIVDVAATFLGTPIRFSPENNPDLAYLSPGYPMQDIAFVKNQLNSDEHGFHTFINVVERIEDYNEPIFMKEEGECFKIFCNIVIGPRYFGNLSIPKGEIPLENIDRDLVMIVAQILALSCAVYGIWGYNRTDENLFKALLYGLVTNLSQLAMRTQNWEAYQNKEWRLICATIPKETPEAMLLSGLERIFPGCPVATLDETINILLDVTQTDIDDFRKEKLKKLAQSFGVVILVGMRFDDILECSRMHSCLLGYPQIRDPKPGKVIYCDDNREYSLFRFSGLSFKDLKKYCDPIVISIDQYDQKNGTGYYSTLWSYVNTGKNTAATAAALSVHINTIIYRIKRIHELFGIDLANPATLFSVIFTFRILDFIK